MKTLKHIRIPNKNELDDSKLISIVSKWSKPPDQELTSATLLSDDDAGSASDSDLKIDESCTSQDESSREDEGVQRKRKRTGTESMEEG